MPEDLRLKSYRILSNLCYFLFFQAYLTAKVVPGDVKAENCTTPANQTIFSYYFFRGNETLNDTCIVEKVVS